MERLAVPVVVVCVCTGLLVVAAVAPPLPHDVSARRPFAPSPAAHASFAHALFFAASDSQHTHELLHHTLPCAQSSLSRRRRNNLRVGGTVVVCVVDGIAVVVVADKAVAAARLEPVVGAGAGAGVLNAAASCGSNSGVISAGGFKEIISCSLPPSARAKLTKDTAANATKVGNKDVFINICVVWEMSSLYFCIFPICWVDEL